MQLLNKEMSDKPLTKNKRKKLYKGILKLLSEKARKYFDEINRNEINKWDEKSFDAIYKIANLGTIEKIIETQNIYLIIVLSHPYVWPILIDSKEFTKIIYKNLPKEPEEKVNKIINMFKQEHPNIFE